MKDYIRKVALFDLDGTLADYDGQLLKDLKKIASPNEPPIIEGEMHNVKGGYMEKRRHMITSQVGWWLNLKKFKLGFDVIDLCKEIGFEIVVLTKGPSTKYSAWSEKVEWCNIHLKDYIAGVTITNDKGLVYGKVLVDDFPPYIEAWLEHRPRGLVIMPAHDHNSDFYHPNVIRYDGTNLDVVKTKLEKQFNGGIDVVNVEEYPISVITGLRECPDCEKTRDESFSSHCKSCGQPVVY